MLAITKTAALRGIEGINVSVEVDSSRGLPSFHIVGLGDQAVKEAGERVRMAILNEEYDYPKGRVTVNLYPAWIRKKGSHFDLPIAMGLLNLVGVIGMKHLVRCAFFGELSLEGKIIPVKGVLPMMSGLTEEIERVYVPKENYREAYLALRGRNKTVIGVSSLKETVEILKGLREPDDPGMPEISESGDLDKIDFKDVKGHWQAKEAIVTAIAGGHGLLMMGSPGTGKTMLAQRIPTILPEMSPEEQMETSMAYSLTGALDKDMPIISQRPFRKLSPRTSQVGILGGGSEPMPGEATLAHNGVLFMDEFLEYSRSTIESLRKPMEDKKIIIIRRGEIYQFPSDFILVGAANPCKCGYYGDPTKMCKCSKLELDRYRSKLSGPITDRIDMLIELPRIDYENLQDGFSYSSSEMKEKVEMAMEIQKIRFRDLGIKNNSQMTEAMTEEFCYLGREERELMEKAYIKYDLSPRRYYKVLKLARTIQDLKGCGEEDIDTVSLYSALGYTRYLNLYDKDLSE